MEQTNLLSQLEELARTLSIEVRYEPIKKDGSFSPGGLCRLKDRYLIIINSQANTGDRIQALARAVSRFDLSGIYLRPGIRDYLSGFGTGTSGPSSEQE
ncbi:MAG: hypothetical protein JW821_17385 [Deltaproteobacteria bacterium]|nr:hypothetical protein [Deltaproteobacteria bacterium]